MKSGPGEGCGGEQSRKERRVWREAVLGSAALEGGLWG